MTSAETAPRADGTEAESRGCTDSGRPGQRAAERLLSELRQEVARADAKAAVLVGAQGMAAAAVVGLLAGSDWRPSSLTAPGEVLWWLASASFLASLAALLLAVMPRYGRSKWRPGHPLTYFADIRGAADLGTQDLTEALLLTEQSPLPGLLSALAENSRIAAGKHRWIRIGLAAFAIAAVLFPTTLLAS